MKTHPNQPFMTLAKQQVGLEGGRKSSYYNEIAASAKA